MGKILPGM
jgi:hypothetical protein